MEDKRKRPDRASTSLPRRKLASSGSDDTPCSWEEMGRQDAPLGASELHLRCQAGAIGPSAWCHLHDPDPDKDLDTFLATLSAVVGDGRGVIDLRGVIFPASFPQRWFVGKTFDRVFLRQAQFAGEVSFDGCRFRGDADFTEAEFRGLTCWGTTFEGDLLLVGASLHDLWLAEDTSIKGDFFASWLVVEQMLHVQDTAFDGRCDFLQADLGTNALFLTDHFRNGADFKGATLDAARFRRCHVENAPLEFRSCSVKTLLSLHSVELSEGADVRLCRLAAGARLVFRDLDLSRTRLSGTDLKSAEFEAVEWATVSTAGSRRRAIADEALGSPVDESHDDEILTIDHEETTAAMLEVAYAQLKTNSADRGWSELAGEFHIGALEARRRQLPFTSADRWPLEAYRVVSLYGERWLRPLGWLAVAIALFALFIMFSGLKVGAHVVSYGLQGEFNPKETASDFILAANYGLQLSILQKPVDTLPTSTGSRVLASTMGIVGPLLVAMLGLALRQKFRR